MTKLRVFADTCVIIEAFRTGCWKALCSKFAIETVEKCIEEALTGDPFDKNRTKITLSQLTDGLAARHTVTREQIANLVLAHPDNPAIDDGELHLLAWIFANETASEKVVLLTTADKAALVASSKIGWIDALVSLEQLATESGVGNKNLSSLSNQYRKKWLNEIRMKITMGVIP